MEPLFNRVVIAGIGLVGGSLALAGKKAGVFGTVVGLCRRQETLDEAKALGIADEYSLDPLSAVAGADLFITATPPETIVPLCLMVAEHLPDGAIMTDCGSVKLPIVEGLAETLPKSVRFVGGHPVAGTEKSGPSSARADLFEGKYAILTPTCDTNIPAIDLLNRMWEEVGAKVLAMTPKEHDLALAVVSHLPHFSAYALTRTLGEMDTNGSFGQFAAGGFKDISRIAGSDPAMWAQIMKMNKDNVLKTIGEFEKQIAGLKQEILKDDFSALERRFTQARSIRQKLPDA